MSHTRRPFIHDDFLLQSAEACRLYHEYAATQPLIDYHTHLSAAEIAADQPFRSLTSAWLAHDHYKWRAMRTAGIAEHLVTGEASDNERFAAWAHTVSRAPGNPLYHWTHLELARWFGIFDLLGPDNAEAIRVDCDSQLQTPQMRPRALLNKAGVQALCTTDDPCDTLEAHSTLAREMDFCRVLPTFRAERFLNLENPAVFMQVLDDLGKVCASEICSLDDLLDGLKARHGYFHEHGCRISDMSCGAFEFGSFSRDRAQAAFDHLRAGHTPDKSDSVQLKSLLLFELASLDCQRGWTMQLHLGALRNLNSRQFTLLGADRGYDAMDDTPYIRPLAAFFDALESSAMLPRTIVYNLNPSFYEPLAALAGCFQDGSIPGKIQLGAAWWFMDQHSGIERQLDVLSSFGLLSTFIGMLTDSRSLLSFPRHEYFRRILCNRLGSGMRDGLLPCDFTLMGDIVTKICCTNAAEYLKII